jgi:hypothetical protein
MSNKAAGEVEGHWEDLARFVVVNGALRVES